MIEIPKFQFDEIDDEALRSAYYERGYVLVKDVVSAQERDEIVADLAKINRGEYDCDPIPPLDEKQDDETVLGRYMYIGDPHSYSPIIHNYITHSGICRILSVIVGTYVPFWDGAYKCMQTMFVTKKPGGKGSPWHQDEEAIPTRDRSLTGVWIPLADAEVDNGCLWILPDSHKTGMIYPRSSHNLPDYDSMPLSRGFDESGAVPVEMKVGEVLFFTGYMLHSSKTNNSSTYRPTLTMHYCSSATLLPWKGERNYRGVVQIRGKDPYADEGYIDPKPWARAE